MRDISQTTSASGGRPPAVAGATPTWSHPVLDSQDDWITARWEEQLPDLLERLSLPTDGVVQVGAHIGQEVPALTRCGFRRLVMMEPNTDHTAMLRQQLQVHHGAADLPAPAGGLTARELVLAAAGRERGELVLHVTEYDQQASLLVPMLPMAVVRQDRIPVVPVREVQAGCNVLAIDAQGAEFEAPAGRGPDPAAACRHRGQHLGAVPGRRDPGVHRGLHALARLATGRGLGPACARRWWTSHGWRRMSRPRSA